METLAIPTSTHTEFIDITAQVQAVVKKSGVKTGATVSFWYTYTDTSDFSSYNKGYHDKGVAIVLPARMFYQEDMNERYRYAISPWTRDVGQLVRYWNTLADFVSGVNPSQVKTNLKELKE